MASGMQIVFHLSELPTVLKSSAIFAGCAFGGGHILYWLFSKIELRDLSPSSLRAYQRGIFGFPDSYKRFMKLVTLRYWRTRLFHLLNGTLWRLTHFYQKPYRWLAVIIVLSAIWLAGLVSITHPNLTWLRSHDTWIVAVTVFILIVFGRRYSENRHFLRSRLESACTQLRQYHGLLIRLHKELELWHLALVHRDLSGRLPSGRSPFFCPTRRNADNEALAMFTQWDNCSQLDHLISKLCLRYDAVRNSGCSELFHRIYYRSGGSSEFLIRNTDYLKSILLTPSQFISFRYAHIQRGN